MNTGDNPRAHKAPANTGPKTSSSPPAEPSRRQRRRRAQPMPIAAATWMWTQLIRALNYAMGYRGR